MLESKYQEFIQGKILQQIRKTMFENYDFLHAFAIQIEINNFQISMCLFDRKPTITSGNPANLEFSPNVEGLKAFFVHSHIKHSHIIKPKAQRKPSSNGDHSLYF